MLKGIFGAKKPNVEELSKTRNVEGLVRALQYQDDGSVRRDAAVALGDIGDPKAIAPLIQAMGDRSPVVRRYVAEALGKLGDAGAVECLAQALLNEGEDNQTADAVAEAIVKIGHEKAVDLVAPRLKVKDKDRFGMYVVSRIAEVLGRLGYPSALDPLLLKRSEYWSKGFLNLDMETARVDDKIGEAVARIVEREPDASIPILTKLAKHPDKHVRHATITALRTLKSRAPVGPLIESLKDEYGEVRWGALEALLFTPDVAAIEPLTETLRGSDRAARNRALVALCKIGDKRAIDALKQAANDEDPDLARLAQKLLKMTPEQRRSVS